MANDLQCCFCGIDITQRESDNPAPLDRDEEARCCHSCNRQFVLPFRIALCELRQSYYDEIERIRTLSLNERGADNES